VLLDYRLLLKYHYCLHNRINAATIALPHGSESGLASDVPHLDSHIASGDLAHVESNCGYHVLSELAGLQETKIISK